MQQDEFYRPVQVIDYQNSTMAPKVIEYGHKAAGACDDFKPVQTFEYGHFSANNAAPNMSKNQRKKENNKNNKMTLGDNSNQQAQGSPANAANYRPANAGQPQQQQQMGQQQAQYMKNATNATTQIGASYENKAQNDNDDREDFEEISDTDDNMQDEMRADSPPPPPPPMLSSNRPFMAVQSGSTTKPLSIFPSTAAANDNIQQTSANHVQMSFPSVENQNTITIDEILLKPGRLSRPKKICMILRGPPGSGKSHVAKMIKEKENEMGGSNPRILSIDDYFLIENDYVERCPKTGKKIPKKEILYEYEKSMEETYMQYLIKGFKKTISDNLYDFIIIDCNNNSLRSLNEFYCHSKDSGFMPYIIDLFCDAETCLSRNAHNRTEKDIRDVIDSWKPTPLHYIKLDISSLLENVVEMEDAEDMVTDDNVVSETADSNDVTTEIQAGDENEDDSNEAGDPTASCGFLKSKWENDTSSENLARLDGTSKLKHKKAATMEAYLQMDDWVPPKTSSKGKKRQTAHVERAFQIHLDDVRWADIEEKSAQEKMRAIGFVVGQTDWKRMMDPHAGNRALNRTKYIERVNKRR